MSDPNPRKRQAEVTLVEAFLQGIGCDFVSVTPGPDPPDVIVERDGKANVHIELRRYDREPDRVGMDARWGQLRDAIFAAIGQRPALKGVSIDPIFSDARVPRRKLHQAITRELIECAEKAVGAGLKGVGRLRIAFSDHVSHDGFEWVQDDWHEVASSNWPILSDNLEYLIIDYLDYDGYMISNSPSVQAAWPYSDPDYFRRCFEEKDRAIRRAIGTGKYVRGDTLLWLVISCNHSDDISSFIFGDDGITEAVVGCGFDFGASLFDHIWLVDASGGGRAQSLYPRPAATG